MHRAVHKLEGSAECIGPSTNLEEVRSVYMGPSTNLRGSAECIEPSTNPYQFSVQLLVDTLDQMSDKET